MGVSQYVRDGGTRGQGGRTLPQLSADQLNQSQTRGAGYAPDVFSPGATPVCTVHFANARHRLHLNVVVLNLVRCKALRSCKNERKKIEHLLDRIL